MAAYTNYIVTNDPANSGTGNTMFVAFTATNEWMYNKDQMYPDAAVADNFLIAEGSPLRWVNKTLAQVKTLLGLALTFTSNAIGFAISGGTSSKTLTVSETSTIDQNLSTSSTVKHGRIGLGVDVLTGYRIQIHETADATASKIKVSNAVVGATATDGFDILVDSDGKAKLVQLENYDLEFWTNATQRYVITNDGYHKFGNITGGNYTTIEADGTVVSYGDATVWEDINIDLSPLQSGGTAPGFVTIATTGIRGRAFAVNEDVDGAFEIPHAYKLGSNLTPHIHFLTETAPTGTDYVKFQLIYKIVNGDGIVGAADGTIDTGNVAVDTQWKRYDANFTTFSNASLGGQVLFNLKRIAAAGDAYAGEIVTLTFGFHYERDMDGSRQITTK